MSQPVRQARDCFDEASDHFDAEAESYAAATFRELVGLIDRVEQLDGTIAKGRKHIQWLFGRVAPTLNFDSPAIGEGLVAAFCEGFDNISEELQAHQLWVEQLIFKSPQLSVGSQGFDEEVMEGLFLMIRVIARLDRILGRLRRRVRERS